MVKNLTICDLTKKTGAGDPPAYGENFPPPCTNAVMIHYYENLSMIYVIICKSCNTSCISLK